ncbi:hypothetical protein OOU_Y34scaffold00214g9 [Pyricularia oryzae Y34]|uniref:Uncharacterized protein n=2 Tax=Pyricularia oryzae TaxID=318829 RepID=A0AA97PPN5_PYRO3|nr:hypothetical protein OOU_Y34scaffold00214g9 [Pyricularia oryzae Y34]
MVLGFTNTTFIGPPRLGPCYKFQHSRFSPE